MSRNFFHKIYNDTTSALQYHQLWRFACAILIGVLMVKAGWPKEKVAIYELLFFAAHLLSFAWSTGVNNALLAYYPTLDEGRKKILLFNAGLLLIIISVIVASVFWVFNEPILHLLTDHQELPYTEWITLYLICSPATVLIQAIYLLRSEPNKITHYTHAIFILQLGFIITAIFGFGTVEALVVCIAIWSLIKLMWLLIILIRHSQFQFDSVLFKAFGWFAIPLILQFVLSNGMEYVDGIIVNQYFSAADFPVFRYGSRELPITVILVVSLSSAMIPLAVKHLDSTLQEIKLGTRKLMHVLFPLSIVLILTSPFIYTYVYSQDYIASAQLFNIYLLILTTRILLPQVVMYARQRNGALLVMTFIELIINVSLSIWWAQSYGLTGIAYATVVANICHTMMMIVYNKVSLRVSPISYIPFKTYSIYVFLIIGAYLASTQMYSYG